MVIVISSRVRLGGNDLLTVISLTEHVCKVKLLDF
jgi:hypothetical protein